MEYARGEGKKCRKREKIVDKEAPSDSPMEGGEGQSGISNPPRLADTQREMPNGGITPPRPSPQGEGERRG